MFRGKTCFVYEGEPERGRNLPPSDGMAGVNHCAVNLVSMAEQWATGKPLSLSPGPEALTRCGALRNSHDLSDSMFFLPETNVLNPCPLCQIISVSRWKRMGVKALMKPERFSLLLE